MKKLSIKDWDEQDQPREKLLSKGIASLSDAELLAILIGSGSRSESAVQLCKRILLHVDNNLAALGDLGSSDLINNFKGIGEAKAVSIVAALELGRRRNVSPIKKRNSITSSGDVFSLMHPLVENLVHEEFWCLLLSRANKILKQIRISQGGVSGTVVDNRIILKHAVDHLASGIIVCHNHPSGNKLPSGEDREITQKLKESCLLLDMKLLDHVIIAGGEYFSFADEGIL